MNINSFFIKNCKIGIFQVFKILIKATSSYSCFFNYFFNVYLLKWLGFERFFKYKNYFFLFFLCEIIKNFFRNFFLHVTWCHLLRESILLIYVLLIFLVMWKINKPYILYNVFYSYTINRAYFKLWR